MELPGIPLEHGYIGHGHSNLGHSTTTLNTMGHGHLDSLHAHPHHQSTAIIHHALINSATATNAITSDDSKKIKSKPPSYLFSFLFFVHFISLYFFTFCLLNSYM